MCDLREEIDYYDPSILFASPQLFWYFCVRVHACVSFRYVDVKLLITFL